MGQIITHSNCHHLVRLLNMTAVVAIATAISDSHAADLTIRELQRFSVPEAHQAVAVDSTSFYAISNRTIARYPKRATGTQPEASARWTAPADSPVQHLNSGIVHDGRLYCANSNWPKMPLRNTVEIFEAQTLQHLERKKFPETAGAINWIEHHRGAWWIVFAFYGEADVRKTRLVRYDDKWHQTGVWTFPEPVIQRFLPNSNSGGAFGPNGQLLVTGHDHPELYILEVPDEPGPLVYVATVAAPIAGQGIAWDHSEAGTLFGIVRRSREVVTMRISG